MITGFLPFCLFYLRIYISQFKLSEEDLSLNNNDELVKVKSIV